MIAGAIALRRLRQRMGADFFGDQIDGSFPIDITLGPEAVEGERLGRLAAVGKDGSAGLAADGERLMPLDRIDVRRSRR